MSPVYLSQLQAESDHTSRCYAPRAGSMVQEHVNGCVQPGWVRRASLACVSASSVKCGYAKLFRCFCAMTLSMTGSLRAY